MRRPLLVLALAAAVLAPRAPAAQEPNSPLRGRWDLTFRMPGDHTAGWLEVWRSGNSALVGQFVGNVGSARPISHVEYHDDAFRFSIPPQWEDTKEPITVEGRLRGDSLRGSITVGERRYDWAGVRAPSLERKAEPRWGTPVRLLQPSGLAGWHVVGGESHWEVKDGVLRSTRSGGNLVSDRAFGDFKLHLEFRYPEKSNSGVYLRGRYEVQVEDPAAEDAQWEPATDMIGAVYGFLAPSRPAARRAGEWQSYDITLVGRRVTVVLNGVPVIQDREIPGITGGALDSREGEPGPLMLQGDHGPIEYRNLVVTPGR